MKNPSFFITFLFLFCTVLMHSQKIDLTELKAPSSPAFTILGIQPAEIARPTSYEAFQASLFENLSNTEGFSIPQNVALEFTPFWLAAHPKLSFEDLINSKNIANTIVQNSSISIATIDLNSELDSIVNGTRMGIGYRTFLFKGSPSKENRTKLMTAVSELKKTQRAILGTYQPLFQVLAENPSINDADELKEKFTDEIELFFDTQELSADEEEMARKIYTEEVLPSLFEEVYLIQAPNTFAAEVFKNLSKILSDKTIGIEQKLKKKATKVEALIAKEDQDYRGFYLEFSSALALDFQDSKFNNSYINKWGVWLTPSYRTKSDQFEFLGVVRYLENTIVATNSETQNIDAGAKIAFQTGRFSLSGEAIFRFQNVTSSISSAFETTHSEENIEDLKAVLTLEYKLTDSLLLTYTFGQNFDQNTEINGNVVSTIGLNYDLGGKKIIKDFSLD